MLRLHFSAEDLARVRLRGSLGPLAETVLALRALCSPRDAALLGEWRRRIAVHLPPTVATVAAQLATSGFPPVDLVTTAFPAATVEQGLAALRALVVGRAADPLAALLGASYDLGIVAHWATMRAHLDAERAARSRVLADGGIDRLFATLHPTLRWRPPVLELADWPRFSTVDHALRGRGIDVVPSVFCRGSPQAHLPPGPGPLVLIYPAVADLTAFAPRGDDPRPPEPLSGAVPDGLAHLLGQTRAAVLTALTDGGTTGELARRLRISPAGASQHATVLRRAGLILSNRQGNTVLHTLTPLGTALLDGWLTPAEPGR
jgi:DNA-binding transcriptional ArsR family regulator